MTDRPGSKERQPGKVVTALHTSVRGNATAYGFSIMITASYGALTRLQGSPSLLEIMVFALGAVTSVVLVEAAVTRGFVSRAGQAPPEVRLLGTAFNWLSVGASVGACIGVGAIATGYVAWAVASFAAAGVYVLAESLEMLAAEIVQLRRGDAQAATEDE
jgi:ABC-type branched-subunit amino acid transport system permease subunit